MIYMKLWRLMSGSGVCIDLDGRGARMYEYTEIRELARGHGCGMMGIHWRSKYCFQS
jgi:hypothetical protein